MSANSPGRVKICIPVVGPGRDEALHQIHTAAPLADLLELRMDLIIDGNLKKLVHEIRNSFPPVKIVVTHRRPEESGLQAASVNKLNEEERVAVLQEAVQLGVDYVDMELSTPVELRDLLKVLIGKHSDRTKLIISVHDFSLTPYDDTLEDLWQACRDAGAGVIKIVTFAQTMADNLRVLRLIPWSLEKGQEIVTFAMGEQGKISRVMAPLLGAHFTFASLGLESATAPGQLTAEEMVKIMELLGESRSGKKKHSGQPSGSTPDEEEGRETIS